MVAAMTTNHKMSLGNFCLSLAVKNLAASQAFYAKLGFEPGHGDGKRWIVMRNGTTSIALFEGMFDKNMLTFNPGWDAEKQALPEFTDVHELLRMVRAQGIEPTMAEAKHFMLADPDGNPILVDQHV